MMHMLPYQSISQQLPLCFKHGMTVPSNMSGIYLAVLICGALRAAAATKTENNPIIHLKVDLSGQGRPLSHFWASTGFTSPLGGVDDQVKFLLSNDVFKNLAIIGSLPQGSIEQVRIHWLLDLVRMPNKDNLDFSILDRLIHHLWTFDLRPGFEIMGNPSGFFDNFGDPAQVIAWKNLVQTLAEHYVDRYGIKEVSRWNFESWNEPDHGDFGKLNFTEASFLAYYDATSEGLLAAHNSLKFGGPGGSCREPHFIRFCRALLLHAQNGTNYFTGKRNVRLDFISFHKKGQADSASIIQGELETIEEIRSRYPALVDKPVFNDEGDPLKSWWRELPWRGGVAYPALVAETLVRNVRDVIRIARLELFSNDNAFLNVPPAYFDQRTLLTRFMCNDSIASSTSSQFVQKPIFNLMAMLSLLGNSELRAYVDDATNVSVLVTKTMTSSKRIRAISILVGNSDARRKQTLEVALHSLPNLNRFDRRKPKFLIYKLTEKSTNPRKLWLSTGSPECPTKEEIRLLRLESQLKRGNVRTLDRTHFSIALPGPSVKLLQICYPSEDDDLSGQPTRIRFYLDTWNVVLITWRFTGTECLKGFSVEYSSRQNDGFLVANKSNETLLRFFHFHDAASDGDRIWFRVRALDVWGRFGPYSVPQMFDNH